MNSLLPLLFIIFIVLYASSIYIGRTVEGIFLIELLMMVLPYLLLLNGVLLTIFLYIILTRHYSFVTPHIGIPFFVLLIITIAMGYWIYDFSYTKENHLGQKELLKVAFLNKLYENKNYEEMKKSIQKSNPDVIGFSEVTKEDLAHITFQDTYPYMYKKPYRSYYLVMLSKYPLTIGKIPDAQDTLLAQANIRGKKYNFIVTHPFAVLNRQSLLGRNKELKVLSTYVSALKDPNLVLLGDMNTSPWSSSYVKFASSIHGFKNAAKGAGLAATWTVGPLITQIDHIFISGNLNVLSYASVPVPGSDHHLQLATLSGLK